MPAELTGSIGPYRIIAKIGSGGMGDVYHARDTRLARDVALKTIRAAPGAPIDPEVIRAEARAAARLNHPNIAAVYDVLETDRGPCIVMELVSGQTLATRLRQGPLPVAEATGLIAQLADGLAAAHAEGVVHRDVKPANIQITAAGHVKLLDLGIAKIFCPSGAELASTRLDTSMFVRQGTPGYMAPEQLQARPVSPATDIYSVGVVMFEMLTGRRPFDTIDPIALGVAMVTETAPDVREWAPSTPPALSDIIRRSLRADPRERHADGAELALAIRAIGTQTAASMPPPRHRRSIRWRAALASASSVAFLAAAIAVFGTGNSEHSQPLVRAPAAIALLPVLNLSGDRESEDTAAGLGALLAHNLSALPNSTIVSGAATGRVRAGSSDGNASAARLGLSHLVDISLRRSEAAYTLDAVVRRASGEELWRDRFQGGVVSIQREFLADLEQALVRGGVLSTRLAGAARDRFHRLSTDSDAAFHGYAKGRALLRVPSGAARVSEAIAALEAAVSTDPRFAAALAGLSDAYRTQYQRTQDREWLAKAAGVVEKALEADAGLADAHYAQGNLRGAMGEPEEAIGSLRTAITLQPSHEEARRLLGRLLAANGRFDEGVAELQRVIELHPDSWNSHYTLAFAYYAAGKHDEAVPHLRRVTELQPAYASAYTMLGAIHHRRGDLTQAAAHYEHAARLTADAAALSNLGMIYYAAARFEESLQAFQRARGLDPASAMFARNTGDAYTRLGRHSQAREMYESAASLAARRLETAPRDVASLSLLAVCEAKLGRRGDAISHAAQALVLAPDDQLVHYRQAVVHALLDDPQVAIEALDRAFAKGFERRRAREDDDLSKLRAIPAFTRLTADPLPLKGPS